MVVMTPAQYEPLQQQIRDAAARGDQALYWHGNAQAMTHDGVAMAVAQDGGSAIALAKPRIIQHRVEVERPRSRRKRCIITVLVLVLLVVAGLATGIAIYEVHKNDSSEDDDEYTSRKYSRF